MLRCFRLILVVRTEKKICGLYLNQLFERNEISCALCVGAMSSQVKSALFIEHIYNNQRPTKVLHR